MSSFERHLRRQAQRTRLVAARDLSVEELAEAERVVRDLTDQAARAIFEEDDDNHLLAAALFGHRSAALHDHRAATCRYSPRTTERPNDERSGGRKSHHARRRCFA